MMDKKKKELILLCNKFPFGFGEAFLEAEFPYLYQSFEKITIVSNTDSKELTRTVDNDVVVLRKPRTKSTAEVLKTICYLLVHLKTFVSLVYQEIKACKYITSRFDDTTKSNRYRLLIPIFHDAFRAFNLKMFLETNVLNHAAESAVLYAYWQDYTALALALIKYKSSSYKAICRAHRVDLYFDASKYNYLTFRSYISDHLDKVVFISEDGLQYQSRCLNKKYNNYIVSRLGTEKIEESDNKNKNNTFLLVSCSTLTPVKRVDLIINALAMIAEIDIQWIHFGDGKLKNKLLLQAKERLDGKANISYTFKGNVSNTEIHKFYANTQVNCFINVSESEGIPVSIMEAMSYGIPVIATDVGGTRELVDNDCGVLAEPDITEVELAKIILKEFNSNLIYQKGSKAKLNWQKKFSAHVNYKYFINDLHV
ncbi:glycosyltransferase [uncultured Draconibacterium sp.]|uniref:glycosyltransferase n=1 Tax=uncultured Draconibacterium sp. TaxID=1573823 RepID=UPI003260059C